MPLDSTTKSLLGGHYGSFPGPDDYTYDVAVFVSETLSNASFSTAGAIAVCWSRLGWIYIGMSPSLQKVLLDRKNGINHIPWLIAILKKGLKTNKIWLCTDVQQQIAKNYSNPGCAEKKVISAVRKFGDHIVEMSITQHPLDTDTDLLGSYEAVGDKQGTYIVPCKACLQVAKAYL